LGIADNIRGFFSQQEAQTEKKSFSNFPTSQVVFPFNTDAGFFSGTNQMSPEGNSAALACLNVLGTAFSEPPLKVYLKTQEGEEYVENHPAAILLENPNPNMTANLMNNYIVTSVAVYGDAFILKLRNDAGAVVQLIPLLPEMVEVKGNDEKLITKYQYKQKGNTLDIMPEDMIHLRERIDPRNHRRGLAPLRSVMVEILGDAAASQMGAALVKNTGVPSVVISPKNDLSMTSDEAENIAEVFGRRFGGENRGRPLVISGGEVDIQTLSFSPKDLEIGKLRYINEERISAVLGVPAILAGLGAGLERATYSNAKELREFFTEQKLIPMWNHFANEFTKQLLLEDYESNPAYCFKYDLSDVRALSQDEDATMARIVQGYNAGFITVNEARQANQLPALDNGDYFVRNMTVAEVPVDGSEVTMYHGTEFASDETVEEKGKDAHVITSDGERVHTSWLEKDEEDEEKALETKVDNVPTYIQKNAQRGLDLLEFAGDGLTDKTKREARAMANGTISDSKVVRMAAWFSRHEGDLDSEDANAYLSGDRENPTKGQVAWLLWGGDISKSNKMRAYNWATKEAEKVKEEKSEKFDLYGWEEPTTKFIGLPTVKAMQTDEEKAAYWKSIDSLRQKWEDTFQTVYAKELNRQRRAISKAIAGSSTLDAMQTNIDIVIEDTKFDKELLPLFYSLTDDFSVRTYDNLFPKNDAFKAADPVDLGVTVTEEQAIRTVFDTLAELLPAGRTLKKIVNDGFYRGQREVPPAVGTVFQDGQSASFLQENAKSVMKDLNSTTKKRVSTIVAKALKEFEDLGVVNPVAGTPEGDKFFNQLAKNINTVLGGQSLNRAKTIARTEVVKASSWSQQRAAKSTGKRLEKEWVSQRDGVVREAHFILDNQRVPADSFYLYNGIKLDFPADPKAPAALTVNCRCTEAYIEVIDE
jgi:HK97 family phage portal protein